MRMFSKNKFFASAFSFLSVLSLFAFPLLANAAATTSMADTMSRQRTSTLSDHTIQFITPTGVDASTDTITITFASGFAMGTFNVNNIDLAVSAAGTCATFTDKTVATTAGASVWGASMTGQVITLTAPTNATTGEVAAGRCVQIEIGANATTGATGVSQITNPVSAGAYTISIAGTFGDNGSLSVPINANDQVVVTASVDPTISFSLSANAVNFGALTTATARYADSTTGSNTEVVGHTMAAGTNAANGYSMFVRGDTLKSGTDTITAIGNTATAPTSGTRQFGIRLSASGGSGSVSSPYATSNYAFAATPTTQSTIATSTVQSSTTTYSTYYVANIDASTSAGQYSTVLTYTAVGNF